MQKSLHQFLLSIDSHKTSEPMRSTYANNYQWPSP